MKLLLALTPSILVLSFALVIIYCMYRRRWKVAYKYLMSRINKCQDYQELCALELQVDQFYELGYPSRPELVAKLAINLYNAINERTLAFTGYKTHEPREDIGRLLQA